MPPRAPVVIERAGEHPRDVLRRLGLRPGDARPVIVVSGGADELQGEERSAARSALGPAVRAAVACTGAAVIDGGT